MIPYPLTLETTEQEIFNTVWKHFVTDGNPRAVTAYEKRCLYRTNEGNACAVGIFLNDVTAKKFDNLGDISGGGIANCVRRFPEGLEAIEKNIQFFVSLQNCHDNGEYGTFEPKLVELAKERGLTVPMKE